MEIDEDLARRLVDRKFPQWAALPIRRVDHDGWDNRTFRLGDRMTVRMPSGPWYALQVEKEQRWLPRLAPQLPLPIPVPLGRGEPALGYPYPWSVYGWLEGDIAMHAEIADLDAFAAAVAGFLVALERVDATGGPEPGEHNFFRGAPLTTYADETVDAVAALGGEIDGEAAMRVWEDAVAATWTGDPVWFHGDVATGNLLLRDGRLAAVIDFGTSGVGDPSCDVVIAWTLFEGASRDTFRTTRGVDAGTWSRGRGWAIWKALISLAGALENGDAESAAINRRVVDRVIADHAAG